VENCGERAGDRYRGAGIEIEREREKEVSYVADKEINM